MCRKRKKNKNKKIKTKTKKNKMRKIARGSIAFVIEATLRGLSERGWCVACRGGGKMPGVAVVKKGGIRKVIFCLRRQCRWERNSDWQQLYKRCRCLLHNMLRGCGKGGATIGWRGYISLLFLLLSGGCFTKNYTATI